MARIIVLGAGKGIGKATADLAYNKGHEIIGVSRSGDDLKNRKYHTIVADLDNKEGVKDLRGYSSVTDAVVNCTGTHPGFNRLGIDRQIINTINKNIIPALYLYEIFLEKFREQKKGHFIHISSAALNSHDKSEAGYCASKAALESIILCLHDADKETGIKHYAVRVSLTDTPLARRVCPKISDWSQFYTAEETALELIKIIEHPESYSNPIVTLSDRPFRK